jgi:hypothetical protein
MQFFHFVWNVVDKTAPKTIVHQGFVPDGCVFGVKKRCARQSGLVLKRHVENGRDASGGRRQSPVFEILATQVPRIVEMDMNVDRPRENELAGDVFRPVCFPRDIPPGYRGDFPLFNVNVSLKKPVRRNYGSVSQEQIKNHPAPPSVQKESP